MENDKDSFTCNCHWHAKLYEANIIFQRVWIVIRMQEVSLGCKFLNGRIISTQLVRSQKNCEYSCAEKLILTLTVE
jgi:hypothetical protein